MRHRDTSPMKGSRAENDELNLNWALEDWTEAERDCCLARTGFGNWIITGAREVKLG